MHVFCRCVLKNSWLRREFQIYSCDKREVIDKLVLMLLGLICQFCHAACTLVKMCECIYVRTHIREKEPLPTIIVKMTNLLMQTTAQLDSHYIIYLGINNWSPETTLWKKGITGQVIPIIFCSKYFSTTRREIDKTIRYRHYNT